MLRRILTFTFALLLFALAFSIPDAARGPAPPDIISAQHGAPLLVMANLFLPRAAIAQAAAVRDTGPGAVDTTPASARVATDDSNHFTRNAVGGLVFIVFALLVVVLVKRGRSSYNGNGARTS